MLGNKSKWNIFFFFEGSFNESYQIDGDTIINNKTYKKLYQYAESTTPRLYAFYREDTILKKVYRLNYSDFDVNEILIFDFSLSVGQTFFYDSYSIVLDSISNKIILNSRNDPESVFLSIKNPNIFYFNNGIIWIEGIGSPGAILSPFGTICYSCQDNNLLCHFDSSGNLDYHLKTQYEINNCYGPNINDISQINDNNINIYPNPSNNGIFNISGANLIGYQIFDMHGQLVKMQSKQSRIIILDISNFTNGLYIIKLESNNNSIYKKLIKK